MKDGPGGVSSSGNSLTVIGKDKNLTDAIRLAGQTRGSEVVVGYVDPNHVGGNAPIQYAVVDMGPMLRDGFGAKTAKTTFDPAKLDFGNGAKIVSAVVVSDSVEEGADRNYIGAVQFFDVDPDIQADTVIALAEAASLRLGDPNKNKQVEGFTLPKSDENWVKMVHQNRSTVLRQITVTIGTLDKSIGEKEAALVRAVHEGRTGDAGVLRGELSELRNQRDDLAVYQGIIRVDLLTDQKGSGYVPGMTDNDGPVRVGAWRTQSGSKKAVAVLVEQKAMLQGKLAATTDPEQRARLERRIAALDDAIPAIAFKTKDSIRSQGLIDKRVEALGSFCVAVDDSRKEIVKLKGTLTATNAASVTNKANAERDKLVKKIEAELAVFEANGGSPVAATYLREQIKELKLPAKNADDLLAKIDLVQGKLLKQIQGMASIMKEMMPEEGKLLEAAGKGVDAFRAAYKTVLKAAELHETFAKKLDGAAGSQGFRLPTKVLTDLNAALSWDPIKGGRSPFETNQFIVGQYVETSKEIRAYVGSDDADWYAVGAKACNQVGGEIAKVMTVETALATFKLNDDNFANDIRAAKALLALIDGNTLGQGSAVMSVLTDDVVAALREAAKGNLKPIKDGINAIMKGVTDLRQGFVEGNVRIAQNVLMARKIFFEAEFDGKDGVAALQAHAIKNPKFDPEGYMINAYKCIQQARAKVESGDKAGASKLMLKANAYIAMQEQSTFLQTKSTFGNKALEVVLDNAGSSSYLDLGSAGKMNLLNNWTELHTRMGMSYTTAADYNANKDNPKSDLLYFKLTVKADQRIKYDPAIMPPGLKTFKDERGYECVSPGQKLYLTLPPNPPEGSAGYVFVESSKGGDVTRAMLERPVAPEGVGYTYDPDDGLVELGKDAVVAAFEWVSESVTDVFETAPRTRVESIAVNGDQSGPRAIGPKTQDEQQATGKEIVGGDSNVRGQGEAPAVVGS